METGERLNGPGRIRLAISDFPRKLSESERELALSEKIYGELKSTVDIVELNIAWASSLP